MRPLIYGTSPLCGTGYASAVRYVSRGLKARGHEPAIFAWNSHVGPKIGWDGIDIYPRGNTLFGHDVLGSYARQHEADCVLAICDPWILDAKRWRHDHDLPLMFWFPCQSEPASKTLVDVCRSADGAFCYSRWGTDVMREGGLDGVRHVPLGVDTETFKPMDRAEARGRMGDPPHGGPLGDRFLIGMVAANSSTIPVGRKAFDQAFQAFARFKKDVPDAVFYCHTLYSDAQGGYHLPPLLEALDLKINEDVIFPDPAQYTANAYSDAAMALIYNACDVVHQATSAEGFGLPILEAQACGRPVVTTRYSSMPELTWHGHSVPSAVMHWAPSPVDGWVASPCPISIASAWDRVMCGRMHSSPEDGLRLAREHSWDKIINQHLLPAMERALDQAPGKQGAAA